MTQAPGYPLPSGELGEDELVCQLVYLPDRPEYWQAFLGALHYMTTWRAWERDSDKRGKDAAANWREAFELTIGCWRMTCLQDLQDDVAAILAIMQLGNSCCIEQDPSDGDQYTDRVEDGVGDVPQNVIDAGYADDAADWDGFDDYKCMIVHVTVNQMEARLREISAVMSPYGAIFGGVAAVAVMLGLIATGAGLIIVTGIIAAVGSVSLLYAALIEFGSIDALADDVATNHEELACAMYYSDGDEGALIALNDKIDELFSVTEAVILKNLNNGPTLKALYAGRYDQQDIAAELETAGYDLEDFDCSCDVQIGEYLYYANVNDLQSTDPPLDFTGSATQVTTRGYLNSPCFSLPFTTGSYVKTWVDKMRQYLGHADDPGYKIYLNRVKFWYGFRLDNAGELRLLIRHDGGVEIFDYENVVYTVGAWVTEIFSPPLVMTVGLDDMVKFETHNGVGAATFFDELTLDFDATE